MLKYAIVLLTLVVTILSTIGNVGLVYAIECDSSKSIDSCPPTTFCDVDNVCKRLSDKTPITEVGPTDKKELENQERLRGLEGGRSASAGQTCKLGDNPGILTAIGCLPYNPVVLINSLMTFLIGAAGGIALLLMASAAIQMMTQGSDAKALQAAQQRFVGAASGLLFIVFSVLLLRVIGVNILQIPGFR